MISNKSPITKFEILGLHGDRDVLLDFEDPIKILVSENGSGKTTVLNTLFYILTANWMKLLRLQFESVRIVFVNKKTIVIDRNEFVSEGQDFYDSPVLQLVKKRIPKEEFNRLLDMVRHYPSSNFIRRVESVSDVIGVPPRILRDEFLKAAHLSRDLVENSGIGRKFQEISEQIKLYFPFPILYFPTYRRVEEDLSNFGYVEKELSSDEQLIHFGMQDVKARFDQITSEIRDSSVEWYSTINGQMLTQLISGIQSKFIDYDSIEDPAALKIVLDRIGENILDNDKEHILQLINSKKIKQQKYVALAYFLSNLIQVYNQQRSNDNAIKSFARVANQYLGDKEIRYNESKVDIQAVNKRTGKDVLLDRLSSGEKQVVSIFSRLFLDQSGPYAVLFDEPELSLSMEWQKKLLQDIVDSGQCMFLLAATHSPFIFENSLDHFASELTVNFRDAN